jgi:hypothetical protein
MPVGFYQPGNGSGSVTGDAEALLGVLSKIMVVAAVNAKYPDFLNASFRVIFFEETPGVSVFAGSLSFLFIF